MEDIANRLRAAGDAVEAIKRIEDQTKDTNFDWSLLFPTKKRIHLGWLIFAIASFLLVCGAIVILGENTQNSFILLFSGGLLAATWVACCAHLRFESGILTAGVFFSLIVTLLVSGRVLTPSEGAERVLDQVSRESSAGHSDK